MSATVSLIQRNGTYPGIVTQNVSSINWKAIDDTTTPYTSYNAVIGLGTNSFTQYICVRFSGSFTSVGNVSVTHLSGTLPSGIKLMSSPSITLSSASLPYATPTRSVNNSLTSYNLTGLGSSVDLLVGLPASSGDAASSPGKSLFTNNVGSPVYTNYFVTQLQTVSTAQAGDIGNIVLQVTYDEI